MLAIFISQTEETIPLVEEAFRNRNYAEISRIIHKIKPSIEGVGIHSIKDDVRQLEMDAKDPDADFTALYSLFVKIKETLTKAIAELKEELP